MSSRRGIIGGFALQFDFWRGGVSNVAIHNHTYDETAQWHNLWVICPDRRATKVICDEMGNRGESVTSVLSA